METNHFLIDSFEAATRTSRRKALLIGSDHDTRLSVSASDPDIAAIKAVFTPVFLRYKDMYINHSFIRDCSHLATARLEEMFDDLAQRQCQRWNFEVRKLYSRESEVYESLFHKDCKPFYQGSRSERLDSVEVFLALLGRYPDLQHLRDEVSLYLADIKAALKEHRLQMGKFDMSANDLEAERIVLCEALYGSLGLLMNKFRSDRIRINNFFDFKLLKKKVSDKEGLSMGSVAAGETKSLMQKNFTVRSELLLDNLGKADLNFCLAPDEKTSCQDAGLILKGNNRMIVFANQLGSLENHFLNVTNLYTEKAGKYSVSILI